MTQGNDASVPLFQKHDEQPKSDLALNCFRFLQPIQKAKKLV
jgi:hypothetical protein